MDADDMSSQSDKVQRRRLRELAELAYERELSRELSDLEAEFGRWRSGETNAFDLSEAIHGFTRVQRANSSRDTDARVKNWSWLRQYTAGSFRGMKRAPPWSSISRVI